MNQAPKLFMLALDGASPTYIREQAQAGKLPNFARAMREGCFLSDCRPAFPTITPTCWAALETGTTPEVNGITDQDFHIHGTPLDAVVTGYNAENLLAEQFWNSAARAGKKSLVLGMPCVGRSDDERVRVFCYDQDYPSDQPTVPTGREIPKQLYRVSTDGGNAVLADVPLTPSGKWQPQFSAKPLDVTCDAEGVLTLPVSAHSPKDNRNHIEPFFWYARCEGARLRVAAERADVLADAGWLLAPGEWTPVIRRELKDDHGLRTYMFRMKLFYSDGSLLLYVTTSCDLLNNATPRSFGQRVSAIDGIPDCTDYEAFMCRNASLDALFECQQMNFNWQLQVIESEMAYDPLDMVVCYHGYLDEINHALLSALKGCAEGRDFAEAMFEQSYRMADAYLGQLYERVLGEDTTLVIVSDHAGIGFETYISPFPVLRDAGLLAYADDDAVDWSRTVAYPMGTSHVHINLKGRDPQGIVEPDDYARTVQRVIAALQDGFRDRERGVCALAFAVPNEQAGFVGQGGERSGDVVYGISGSVIGGYYGGVHACQISTARCATGDIRPICVISGPAFRRNCRYERPVNSIDIMPTICHALGYPQPAQATGAIVHQLFR